MRPDSCPECGELGPPKGVGAGVYKEYNCYNKDCGARIWEVEYEVVDKTVTRRSENE